MASVISSRDILAYLYYDGSTNLLSGADFDAQKKSLLSSDFLKFICLKFYAKTTTLLFRTSTIPPFTSKT